MFSEPVYAQDIVVGVMFHNTFNWYITDKEYWYLDYTKYDRALLEGGFSNSTLGDYSSRLDIAILDTDTAEHFLSYVEDKRTPASVLSHMMVTRRKNNKEDDLLDFAPCLFVDFDQKVLFSQYPEMIRFEIYVPDGWTSFYQAFPSKVPENARYWIVGGRDLFQK
jgi:hypothetical protein